MKNQTNYLIRLAEFLLVIGLLGYSPNDGSLNTVLELLCWGYLCSYLIVETEYILRKILNPLQNLKESYKSDFLMCRLLRCGLILIRMICPVIIGIIAIGLTISSKDELSKVSYITLTLAGYLLTITSIYILTDFRYEISKRKQ